MDLSKIIKSLENCPCGKTHTAFTEVVEIGVEMTEKVGKILTKAGFPKKILAVADKNSVRAADGIFESLESSGFEVKTLIYDDMKYARAEQVCEIRRAATDVGGIIAIGTGSIGDLCRVASFELKKDFCIFATAPSMDGFASDSAPIIENNFKISRQVEQPRIIIADTKILAKAPAELKSAGFGDMMAKYLGILEWRISNILIGEYYCDEVAKITLDALSKMIALADKVTADDEEAAGAIMEALVLSGLAMKLAGSSRPASGAEHVLSHYLECYKLAKGIWPEYHGKKVGVATLILNKIYRNIAERVPAVHATADNADWEAVYAAFDESQLADVKRLNSPTITDRISPARLEEKWPEIRQLILSSLPKTEELLTIMKTAGCATEPSEVHVSDELLEKALKYHPYMRYRLLIPRILPMLGLDIMDFVE